MGPGVAGTNPVDVESTPTAETTIDTETTTNTQATTLTSETSPIVNDEEEVPVIELITKSEERDTEETVASLTNVIDNLILDIKPPVAVRIEEKKNISLHITEDSDTVAEF